MATAHVIAHRSLDPTTPPALRLREPAANIPKLNFCCVCDLPLQVAAASQVHSCLFFEFLGSLLDSSELLSPPGQVGRTVVDAVLILLAPQIDLLLLFTLACLPARSFAPSLGVQPRAQSSLLEGNKNIAQVKAAPKSVRFLSKWPPVLAASALPRTRRLAQSSKLEWALVCALPRSCPVRMRATRRTDRVRPPTSDRRITSINRPHPTKPRLVDHNWRPTCAQFGVSDLMRSLCASFTTSWRTNWTHVDCCWRDAEAG